MIDPTTGNLALGNGLTISPDTDLFSLQALNLGKVQDLRATGDWKWVDAKNVQIADQFYIFSFLYEKGKLLGFTFVFQAEAFDLNTGWASWSEQKEKESLARFEDWLNDRFGQQREFDWGTVQASYDARSGSSSIRVKYKTINKTNLFVSNLT